MHSSDKRQAAVVRVYLTCDGPPPLQRLVQQQSTCAYVHPSPPYRPGIHVSTTLRLSLRFAPVDGHAATQLFPQLPVLHEIDAWSVHFVVLETLLRMGTSRCLFCLLPVLALSTSEANTHTTLCLVTPCCRCGMTCTSDDEPRSTGGGLEFYDTGGLRIASAETFSMHFDAPSSDIPPSTSGCLAHDFFELFIYQYSTSRRKSRRLKSARES